ncbi:MAG: hypothetical protein NVS2B17_19240 [Candidatus Velthaea sp.]
MKRAIVLVTSLVLAACAGGGDTKNGPDVRITLPPAAAFKDALLLAAIKAKLAGDDIDSTTRIHVEVHGGEVILHGRVPDAAAKSRALAAARGVVGVKSVGDDLAIGNVGRSTAQSASDLGLVAAVESKLVAQTGVNVTRLKVEAKDGTVTLTGQAPSAAIKSTMLDAAKSTNGVRNVVDKITVK